MKKEYIQKIYAGWLSKIIGIRLGAPLEGWTHDAIIREFGEFEDYLVDYREFAADDDSNGPIFLIRALEMCEDPLNLSSQEIGNALLNYAPYEHGFFWWGGYGVSTEHTAYLNLRNGIEAPASGSIRQNGSTVAEQIGGQIFSDTWGLVTPGNPDLAAKYAMMAARVTHDGNAVYGAMFVATCISCAFEEQDIKKIIQKGLSYLPENCEYRYVAQQVIEFYHNNKQDWHKCYQYILKEFGYDKYPGNCHIIPNMAIMILALNYGEGDFSNTLNICNLCGWDTDCNVGNIATIMGVMGGLDAINFKKWRQPINDFLACSSVVGALNIMDIPYGASYIAKLAYEIARETPEGIWSVIFNERIDSCHFEYPGSTHAIRLRSNLIYSDPTQHLEYVIQNSTDTAHTGKRSLKVVAKPILGEEGVFVFKKTYYLPGDFHDSRYDPSFSPVAYPGQTIHGSACVSDYAQDTKVCLYAKELRSGKIYTGNTVVLQSGNWEELLYHIPSLEGGIIEEIGFLFTMIGASRDVFLLSAYIDDLYVDGTPEYCIDFACETIELWNWMHKEISQFSRLKGMLYLQDQQLHISCADMGEAYTGGYNWKDYSLIVKMTPITGTWHGISFRVQGAIRSYAVTLLENNEIAIQKNINGYSCLVKTNFHWQYDKEYEIEVKVCENRITVIYEKKIIMQFLDDDHPYLYGAIGVAVSKGSHCKFREIKIR